MDGYRVSAYPDGKVTSAEIETRDGETMIADEIAKWRNGGSSN